MPEVAKAILNLLATGPLTGLAAESLPICALNDLTAGLFSGGSFRQLRAEICGRAYSLPVLTPGNCVGYRIQLVL